MAVREMQGPPATVFTAVIVESFERSANPWKSGT
jgi:hypothetical protein